MRKIYLQISNPILLVNHLPSVKKHNCSHIVPSRTFHYHNSDVGKEQNPAMLAYNKNNGRRPTCVNVSVEPLPPHAPNIFTLF